MALWSGRFEGEVDGFAQTFGASLEVDMEMAAEDIAGSKAHAAMLAKQGIITDEDARAIAEGLDGIADDIASGALVFDPARDEDIHMAVERVLTERIGGAGARLHTARSRNDQVALDLRLLAQRLCSQNLQQIRSTCETLLDLAKQHVDTVMPGYTHLQHAQPVTLGHHLLAYFWMLVRDFDRLLFAKDEAASNPLGAAALAGTSYPIDRAFTTEQLGLQRTVPNSLDAVSDRDFLLDMEYACAVVMLHLSRLCEEVVLWSSSEFGFITLPDAWSTGSSIMPQKKNPDFAELVRGKSGRVVGDVVGLMITMKSLPLAYNKDLQECKEGALDAANTLASCLVAVEGMLCGMQVNADAMASAATEGFTAATDVADYLVKKGMAFRDAHEVAGKLVRACEQRGVGLEDLALEDFQAADSHFGPDILGMLDPASVAGARTSAGGTSPAAVQEQILLAEERLAAMATVIVDK